MSGSPLHTYESTEGAGVVPHSLGYVIRADETSGWFGPVNTGVPLATSLHWSSWCRLNMEIECA